ncbi:hypothetical protein ACFQX7_30295 [Luedemannella flava]
MRTRSGSGTDRHPLPRSRNAPASARARYGLPPLSAYNRPAARYGRPCAASSSARSSARSGGTVSSVTGGGVRLPARGCRPGARSAEKPADSGQRWATTARMFGLLVRRAA